MPAPAPPSAKKRTDSKMTAYKVLTPLLLVILITRVPGGFRLPVALFFLVSFGWLCSGPILYCWRRANWLVRGVALAVVVALASMLAGGVYHHYHVLQLAEAMKQNGAEEVVTEGALYGAHISWIYLTRDAGDAELAQIARMEGAEKAIRLKLNSCKVTDAGLAQVANLPQLEWLFLADTRITDAGLANLARATSLQYLDIGNLKLTADGAAHLRAVPLRMLFVGDSNKAESFVEAVVDAHPGITVIRR